jgi:hypothetical protein
MIVVEWYHQFVQMPAGYPFARFALHKWFSIPRAHKKGGVVLSAHHAAQGRRLARRAKDFASTPPHCFA